ncbi:MAG: nucleotidyltransferase family protein, partial [Caulobacteraceae bacterium]
FIFLGDMPRIPVEVLQPLADALAAGSVAAQPVHEGRRGHPALIGRSLFPQVAALTGDAGAGALLKSLGDRVAQVDASEGVLFDIDERP